MYCFCVIDLVLIVVLQQWLCPLLASVHAPYVQQRVLNYILSVEPSTHPLTTLVTTKTTTGLVMACISNRYSILLFILESDSESNSSDSDDLDSDSDTEYGGTSTSNYEDCSCDEFT